MRRKDESREKLARYYSYEDYGIDKEKLQELQRYARQSQNKHKVAQAAYMAEPFLAEWLVISAMQGRSYDRMNRGEIVPCGRTDFYGYQRRFYYMLSLELNGTTFDSECDTLK